MIPRPVTTVPGTGELVLDRSTTLTAPAELADVLAWLQGALRPASGLPLREARLPVGETGLPLRETGLPLREAGLPVGEAGLPVGETGLREAFPRNPQDSGGVTELAAGSAQAIIALELDASLGAEAYRLRVTSEAATISAGDAAGAFYGCQALLQLLPTAIHRRALVAGQRWALPAVEIHDEPRFAWSGAMLDVARHFMPKHDVLRFIDLMALHRLNTLHWHLTDDQGWRVEIRRYPRLTEVGAWRHESQVGAAHDAPTDGRPHGGFYTQDDIREIVAYAAQRHITIVPEIESPGHVQAALAAYPQLGVSGRQLEVFTRWGVNPNVLNAEETTVDFFTGVLDEVLQLFPSRYIGVGGDECPKDQWRADPRTQQRLAELEISTEEGLQAWFIRRLDDHLTAAGRRLFGWDEILEGDVAPGATIASWRGMTGAVSAARRGHDVVACPDDLVYLDYRQSESPDEPIPVSIPLTVENVYAFDPVPPELTPAEARHILGGQANIWTEHADSPRTVDYLAFPRLCAVAEALWSPADRDYTDFARRLQHHLGRLDALGVEYRHLDGPRPWQRRPGVPGRPDTREQRAAHIAHLVSNI
ncbi:beta-N-acetylhexosaminidase [Winogradskya consettensis]|uniref:beta-N-acetylhexosaminidase n=1 Tax=Winogradskya consettensis TaxID=113560 RepID=A0A919T260_9ACTN|nr:beta-N-acetylhexosaminidase [Actinoplanes consettensis]GIM85145.1 beta-N-acetylhexosaminidase [Actinoplanes consettensis]